MVHTDKIVKDVTISRTGVIDFKDFLEFINQFFDNYKYGITEKVYDTRPNANGTKTILVKWDADKPVDDYNKVVFKLTFTLTDCKEVYVEKQKLLECNFKFKSDIEVERDYDENWKKMPIRRFIRAVYDKYIAEPKLSRVDNKAKEIMERLKEQIKKYFDTAQ